MQRYSIYTSWSKETPLPGGVRYLLCSLIKSRVQEDPPRSTWYKSFEGGPLAHGSWWGNIVNTKPRRGGGFFRSKKTVENLMHDHMTYTSLRTYTSRITFTSPITSMPRYSTYSSWLLRISYKIVYFTKNIHITNNIYITNNIHITN